MSLIKDTFGKDNGITEEDLNKIIGKYQETSLVECKRATDKNYSYAIKTVIGFLNKPENNSSGLLMIGIDAPKGIVSQIVPIKDDTFKQDRLRNKLVADIASIPSGERPYTLEVIEVPVKGGYVTLVEVQKTNANAVFYSKSESISYIRHSDTTPKWDLGDMFKTALTKNYPIPCPILTLEDKPAISENITKYKINSILRNLGTSPAKDVIVFLKFKNQNGNSRLSLTQIGGYKKSSADPPYIEKLEKEILQINNYPIYPHLDLILGSFEVNIDSNSSLIIDSITYESRGMTKKRFILSHGEMVEENCEFIPYFD